MVATTQIAVFHGAAATECLLNTTTVPYVDTIGQIRFKQADDSNVNTANSIPIPPSGSKYSFRKQNKIKFTTAPAGAISNLRWYASGTPVQSGAVKLNVGKDASYVQGGTGLDNGSTDVLSALTGYNDSVTYIVSSPLVINAGTVLSSPSTGYGTQNYVALQLQVTSTAVPGVIGPSSITYRYDES